MSEEDLFNLYGMTSDAAMRIMKNCRSLLKKTVNDFIDPEFVDTGWREWLESNDIDVSDGSVPSDYLNMPSDESLFMGLISNGTCYGGMTNAHEAVRDLGLGSVDR